MYLNRNVRHTNNFLINFIVFFLNKSKKSLPNNFQEDLSNNLHSVAMLRKMINGSIFQALQIIIFRFFNRVKETILYIALYMRTDRRISTFSLHNFTRQEVREAYFVCLRQ